MHPKKPDPKIGQRFGKLVILKELEYSSDSAKHKFLAKCDCGVEKVVSKFALMSNGVSSCGCLRLEKVKSFLKESRQVKVNVGDTFGRLTVLEVIIDNNVFRKSKCKCICECGNVKYVSLRDLIYSGTQSCGCLQKERTSNARKKEIEIGKRFGRLVVLKEERLEKDSKKLSYRCKCDCGKKCVVRAKLLRNGTTQSCGCLWKEAIYEAQDKKASVTDPKQGDRFGHLTVIEMVKKDAMAQHTRCVKCLCDCGKEVIIPKDQLTSSSRISCGCSKLENVLAKKKENRTYPAELRDMLYYDDDKQRFDNKEILSTDDVTFKCSKCGKPFVLQMQSICKVTNGELNRSFLCSDCNVGCSMQEDDVYNYILSIGVAENDIIRHDRKFLGNKQEIDMLIQSKNLAIEYNGAYWHTDDKRCRTAKYHYNKFHICEQKGFRLLTIFDLDWNNHKEYIKSLLNKSLGLCNNVINASDCVIFEIDTESAKLFLKQNSNNNVDLNCEINIALKYGDEIVFVAILFKKGKDAKQYILNNYAEKNDIVVVNAMNRIIDYFVRTYNPLAIKAYSNNDYYNGYEFEKCGFSYNGVADNYFWLMGACGVYKYEIKSFLDDNEELVCEARELGVNAEKHVMESLGCVKSTRCGFKQWTFLRDADKGE